MSVKKRILIIDDDDALREELTSQFAFFDEFETTAVATATAGIKAAEEGDFDAIVLDIDLPDMQGTDACAVMRKHGVVTQFWSVFSISVRGLLCVAPREHIHVTMNL